MSTRPPSFTVTAAGKQVKLDDSGGARAPFTVTNTTQRPVTGELVARPLEPAKREWLSIVGESIRDFTPNAAEQVVVQLNVPPGSPPGSYAFRLDAVSEDDPDEDYTEGPSVAFDVAAPPPPKKKFPWWIVAVAGAAVLVIVTGVVVFLLVRGGNGGPEKQLVGDWRNVNPSTNSTTHYLIERSGDGLRIHGYGKCYPSDCDWARMAGGPRIVALADASDAKFSIVWDFGFQTQVDDMTLENGRRLKVVSTVTRSGSQNIRTEFFEKAP